MPLEDFPDKPLALPMVDWYDPRQLLQSAHHVLISSILGRHSDHRVIEALSTAEPVSVFDCEGHLAAEMESVRPFWMDYISDTGDGWNPSYAVARAAAGPLPLQDSSGTTHATQRGQVLLLGGDQVYPIASRLDYEQRFVTPFRAALPEAAGPRPKLFALPGNHDWYDSLVSFTRLFIGKERIGGWDLPQTRSYFAVKLPYRWWVLATDLQLSSDIDKPQMEFFRGVAGEMKPGDRVILCVAEPTWIHAHAYHKLDPVYSETNLQELEQLLGRKVAIFLAGDLHHYRRHACADGTQKITAGSGGAFLHPTHVPADVGVLVERDPAGRPGRSFELKASFPEASISRRLAWGNLFFLWHNLSFGLMTAPLYALTSWAVQARIFDVTNFWTALYESTVAAMENPYRAFWVVVTWLAFLLFTDTHSVRYRWIMGTLHSLAHLGATFVLGWGAQLAVHALLGGEYRLLGILATLALVAAGGFLIGPLILGLYLLISVNVFGRHANEAFSGLAIQDYKAFLRMRIDPDGALTLFPVGLQKVPRAWRKRAAGSGPVYEPAGPSSPPELIEDPVVVR